MGRMNDKVALITGAARGIGEGIARAFHREGARVISSDIKDDLGQAVARQLGERASYVHLDVRIEAEWERVIGDVLATHARLDVLVNNAGIIGFEEAFAPHDPEHVSIENWRAVHATNLEGVLLGCKYGIRAMRRTGVGSIINMGSRSGVVGIPAACSYASSKGAVRNHTKSVALYCAEQGLRIRCNVIQPAAILTPMWEPVLGQGAEREARMKEFTKETPLGRWGTIDEVAALAVYLGSDESTYTTGTEFNIDGGILAGSAARPRPAES
ncbi:SDR family oxidoreductase [Pendulispora brunnea]|uniref:SDR family oxidoreductase n=1 Tax=Pendulispora brunnea TaxID=2905690 RepID=A0ABZ2JV70_9BACT